MQQLTCNTSFRDFYIILISTFLGKKFIHLTATNKELGTYFNMFQSYSQCQNQQLHSETYGH